MVSQWNSSGIFSPGFTTLQHVQEVHKFMNEKNEPEQFQGRIIFMSMLNEIITNAKETIGNTNGSSHALQDMQEKQAWIDP